MTRSEFAGKIAPQSLLIDVKKLLDNYFNGKPDVTIAEQKVSFGTSGHRGTSLRNTFNEAHILAITQAICEYRKQQSITGPLYMGKDTHALSEYAQNTALEVLAANNVTVIIQEQNGFTPTPVISHAILTYNRPGASDRADGIVITPSHNPPEDGGFKYNGVDGGPADTDATNWIQDRANEFLSEELKNVKRVPLEKALAAHSTKQIDIGKAYIDDLDSVIDMNAIKNANVQIGADPLGGASVSYWPRIAQRWGLNLTTVNQKVDPTFSFMTVDHDGKIRMDCSSVDAMTSLIGLKNKFDISFANDPDADRHGIVTKNGLLNPNHYLAVCVYYLFQNRPLWSKEAAVGKTVVSSAIIDRVAKDIGRSLYEVPVGFKWFVDGLHQSKLGFGGEESAGASFLRKDGSVWSTDKDGIILNLLAAEILAKTKKDPSELFNEIAEKLGKPFYRRVEAPASREQKAAFKKLTPEAVKESTLGSDPIVEKSINASGNGKSIGGLKVSTQNGWFAARPSGTEDIYKIYAESFVSEDHLNAIIEDAKNLVSKIMAA